MPSAKKAQLKVDGKPLDLHSPPPMVCRIMAFLATLPDNEVMTSQKLLTSLGVSIASIEKASPHKSLNTYKAKHAGRLYWGNPRAIAELRRQQKETEE